jgi:hypothetical protein
MENQQYKNVVLFLKYNAGLKENTSPTDSYCVFFKMLHPAGTFQESFLVGRKLLPSYFGAQQARKMSIVRTPCMALAREEDGRWTSKFLLIEVTSINGVAIVR